MTGIDPVLFRMAKAAVSRTKAAFIPSGGDPAAGGMPPGMPPGDPMAGGMPPGMPGDPMAGGMPPGMPGDPMAGGMPPGDPMAGGMPPGDPMAGGMPDLQAMITEAVQSAMAATGGAATTGPTGKPAKVDINTIATDVFQLKKLMFAMFKQMGMEPPMDILDGPNRDPVTGSPASAPTGGSDASALPPGGGGGDQGAIPPIPPMPAAFPPGDGGGPPKMASIGRPAHGVQQRAASLAARLQRATQG